MQKWEQEGALTERESRGVRAVLPGRRICVTSSYQLWLHQTLGVPHSDSRPRPKECPLYCNSVCCKKVRTGVRCCVPTPAYPRSGKPPFNGDTGSHSASNAQLRALMQANGTRRCWGALSGRHAYTIRYLPGTKRSSKRRHTLYACEARSCTKAQRYQGTPKSPKARRRHAGAKFSFICWLTRITT